MDLAFTQQDMDELMTSEVGRFDQKRRLCERCGHYTGPKHTMTYCEKCGGNLVSVTEWTLFNMFQRVKPHLISEENWLPMYVAKLLMQRHPGLEFTEAYQFACTNYRPIAQLYRNFKKA